MPSKREAHPASTVGERLAAPEAQAKLPSTGEAKQPSVIRHRRCIFYSI
ncbi:MAG: hypothetical protein IJ639_12895 [Ruminococcus sp.]|nr:hypothetical protein [Ruminococcus sp.]